MTPNELEMVCAATQAANQAWVNGQWDEGYGGLVSGADDVTIFGPFGGPAATDWPQRGAKAVRQFSNGSSTIKLIQHYTSGDLLVLVMLEQQSADIAGHREQPWSLRVTQVYRREDGAWKVVHRHADPLLAPRSTEQALTLAAGEG